MYLCPKQKIFMETTRQNKVARLIQKEMSTVLRTEGSRHIPGKMISVTKVRVSPDLGLAKVYLSIFPSGTANDDLKILKKARKTFRFQLGKIIGKQVRVIPELAFFLDDSLDYLENIDNILKN